MRYLRIVAVLWFCGAPALAGEPELNVNARYTVESVEVVGRAAGRLSQPLREDLDKLAGQKFSQQALDKLTERLRRELGVRSVRTRLTRGSKPEHIKIVIETYAHRVDTDITSSKALYHGKEGWTGDLTVSVHGLLFGIVSDGDTLLERFAGIKAGFDSKEFISRTVRLGFLFEDYHQQWNRATLTALDGQDAVPGIYRTRQNFQPKATVYLADKLGLSVGASFQRFQTQFPAARTESANALFLTLRYRERVEDRSFARHRVEAGYNLRAATSNLDSDYIYTSHHADAAYRVRRRREELFFSVQGGRISGRAPLFERFSLGNSQTLRGWNKFDVAPLGGSRMAHGTTEFRLGIDHDASFAVFYDVGAVWDRGGPAVARHALGAGLRSREGFFLSVGFPVRSGHAAPVFTAGVNF